jgi:hypothetical protein
MTAGSMSERYRRWFGLYLLFVAAISTVYGFLNARRGSGWAIGEWLTNYSAGFIRRGLVGEVVLQLGHVSGIPLAWIVFGIQVAVYLTFLWCVYRLTDGLRWGWMVAAVLLSPATLGFIVLDPPNGFKKEILLFAVLAAVICLLLFARLRDWQMAVLLSAFGVILVLSHEPLLFYLPYIFAAVALHAGSMKRALRVAVWPAISCSIAAVSVLLHPGDRAMAEKICSSVGGVMGTMDVHDANVCGGALLWLEQPLAEAHRYVMAAVRLHHIFSLYGLLVIPTLLPAIAALIMLYRRDAARREVKIIAVCSAIAFAGSLAVFYSGRDWGRWLHIHAVCLMLLVLMVSRGERAGAEPPIRLRGSRRWAAWAALAIYATCWTLPAVDIYPARSGYYGLYRYLRGYGQTHGGEGSSNADKAADKPAQDAAPRL